jgi:hypothetical protein
MVPRWRWAVAVRRNRVLVQSLHCTNSSGVLPGLLSSICDALQAMDGFSQQRPHLNGIEHLCDLIQSGCGDVLSGSP